MNIFWSFLSHDGIRLLFFAAIIIGNIAKSRAKAAKQNEAKLRGGTAIRDFSTPDAAPANSPLSAPPNASAPPKLSAPPNASAPFAPPKSAPNAKPPTSNQGSPWSSNQNPFQ